MPLDDNGAEGSGRAEVLTRPAADAAGLVDGRNVQRMGVVRMLGTMWIAPTGQWRAQLPHETPSVRTTQFSGIHTEWPIWIEDFSARSVRRMAPVGQTSAHFVHSGRQ